MGFDFDPLPSNRREYGQIGLDEKNLSDSPLIQFEQWLLDAMSHDGLDPTAMVLSTVDKHGHPNSRVVLLKGFEAGAFVFYTNYESTKAMELENTPYAALNFYWPHLARQVRIRGSVKRVSRATSEAYFNSRSLMSRCSAIVSPQSRVISSRDVLVRAAEALVATYEEKNIECPLYWGGFSVLAEEMEFWQGRDHRLHDRILYTKKDSLWIRARLAS